MITLLIFIIFYALPVYWCKYEIELFFRELKHVQAEFFEVLTCFIPFVNLLTAILYFIDRHKVLEKITDRFFKSNLNK